MALSIFVVSLVGMVDVVVGDVVGDVIFFHCIPSIYRYGTRIFFFFWLDNGCILSNSLTTSTRRN